MTAWIVLTVLAVLFTLAVRHGPSDPPMPYGYDGERQRAELRALVTSTTNMRLP